MTNKPDDGFHLLTVIRPLGRIGATLTDLTDEQAAYIGVDAQGPYKPDHYRY